MVVMNDDSFEVKFSMILSPLNVFVWGGVIVSLIVLITTSVISFTPLREYIPGYSNINTRKMAVSASMRADSLVRLSKSNSVYLANLRSILSGHEPKNYLSDVSDPDEKRDYDALTHSVEDSLLRDRIEADERFNLNMFGNRKEENTLYVAPIKGMVSSGFDLKEKHYGIDVIGPKNEPIKATLAGTVVFAAWTSETGYVIHIQHSNNLLSIYKHSSALFKKDGDFVKAGEAIAIIGKTGELSSGPHLHFELWQNGQPINPAKLMSFE